MKDYGFLTESDIIRVQRTCSPVHDAIAQSTYMGMYPYNIREILEHQIERYKSSRNQDTNSKRTRLQLTNVTVANNINMFVSQTTNSCLRILDNAQATFWMWYALYVNHKTPVYFADSHLKKLKVYEYYTSRVVDIMTKLEGGDFLTLKMGTSGDNSPSIVALGNVEFGNYVSAIDPLDLLDFRKKLALYEGAQKIRHMLGKHEEITDTPPVVLSPKSLKRKIFIYRDEAASKSTSTEKYLAAVICLVEYSIPISDSHSSFVFVCFDDNHRCVPNEKNAH